MDGPFLLAAAFVSALTAVAVPYVTQKLRRARGVPTAADLEYIETLEGLNAALKDEAALRREAEQRCLQKLEEAFDEIDKQRLQLNRLLTRINYLEEQQERT